MVVFQKSDLLLVYSWTEARESENIRINGFSPNFFLYRGEGYEVLPFISKYMKSRMLYKLESFHQIEEILRNSISPALASHSDIKEWLDNNFTH